jgi:predicted cupin superfamily sugar epimerase
MERGTNGAGRGIAGLTAESVAAALGLEPHPEGGFFRETYRSDHQVATARGPRSGVTCILFLVSGERPSRFHRLASSELWLFHAGAPLELTVLMPDGSAETARLTAGPELLAQDLVTPQAIVPPGAWQAARVEPTDACGWSLVSCVVTPGFDVADFELGERAVLQQAYPEQAELIASLS